MVITVNLQTWRPFAGSSNENGWERNPPVFRVTRSGDGTPVSVQDAGEFSIEKLLTYRQVPNFAASWR